ncbi:fumarylacetoacetate hydrolase family protein [Streptomyces sp. NPDC057474]|uniref:fumarylacetoacetate hydrolase family protein n=1 Tax=Streptomyces sp. NPDC057474 TaxID=3346144 RepID=UPI00369CCD3F
MNELTDIAPGTLIAVHLNYRSRAAERGRTPSAPSYFLKPPTTVSVSDVEVVRPLGCGLLAYEGEIALLMGDTPANVDQRDAWRHVQAVTAANDFGVYDLRYADPGSNVHSKGWSGFTPVGPRLLTAAGIDPQTLRVRTWLDSELVQDADQDDMIFGPEYVIADLSRVLRIRRGDLILLGTPTGSSVALPGQTVEVEVNAGELSTGRLTRTVTEGTVPIPAVGALPRNDHDARTAAFGERGGNR